MPSSKPMQNAVLQAVFLHVANMIIAHHLWSATEEIFTNNELYYQITNATEYQKNATSLANVNGTSLPVALNGTLLNNSTAINGTPTLSDSSEESFYKSELPRAIIVVIIVTILEYYWQIWLERILPARPRPSNIVLEKQLAEDDDTREDEIVKKWIAQGKVRRASLSFWNTALKWILDMTVGQLWIACLSHVLEEVLKWRKGKSVMKNINKWELGFRFFVSFIDIRPLASLVAFIVVPAQKRVVFVSGMQLATSTFLGVFVNTVLPWLSTTWFIREIVEKIAEGIRNGTDAAQSQPPPPLRIGDEL